MKQLLVLSGKGGTGKTTVAAAFIALANNTAFADCDVDAPNLHLAVNKVFEQKVEPFYGYQKAVKNNVVCIGCGKCESLCEFGAIKNGFLNEYECEGCGVCEAFCPITDANGEKAIHLEENPTGKTMLFENEDTIFSSAELKMGNGASGKLVTQVRKNLYNTIAEQGNAKKNPDGGINDKAKGFRTIKPSRDNNDLIIIDGSPGIGCPVVASVTGVDVVLMVTEPTISGIHDLGRIMETVERFEVKRAVCINKYDIDAENTQRIVEYCMERNVPIVGKIPFDPLVVKAVNSGSAIGDGPAKNAIMEIYKRTLPLLMD